MSKARPTPRPTGTTRIQREKRQAIFDAALDVFSENGLRGATLDAIAARAGLSKPNVIYYFEGKEAIYKELLESLLDIWIAPLIDLSDSHEPIEELLAYVRRKLDMSRDMPRESRLFATEMIQAAPHIRDVLSGPLKALMDEKAALIQSWMDAGLLAKSDPYHLIFSIWATTQHYADFDVQVRAVLGGQDPFDSAPEFVEILFRRMLTP
ncbi:TetR family transcriptional regulator C-terminal domain-containing protein [Pelagimonas varians]|uniref:HTH-type transcriptional regulator RutR n=1 Tax=Pelagimonas varians TaxID=696760 RepID=A0A238KWB4_9RHOB|nr:TetR family transcriptional regulator C-terminal domain-containing protein [Pelagimonas varians]PYG28328.1 TetR family transcriptional regulator [Pelagimonas varians]SMX46492.1 HTH-type transcriptional regulator RutR [Pelagimonas varians]